MTIIERLKFALGFLNALPVSIFGLALGAFLIATRQIQDVYIHGDFTLVWDMRNEGWFYRRAFYKRGWVGFSCGCCIFVKDVHQGRWNRTVDHERKHSYQYYVWGVLMPVVYILESIGIWLFFRQLHSYYDNHFEIQARRAAGQPAKIPRHMWADGPHDRWAFW